MEFKELMKYIEENKEEHFNELIKKMKTKLKKSIKKREGNRFLKDSHDI
ncbi:hypothetical protein [Bacillus wiedmannii]|nr:hypothetical protein [Bacillus wiedmannii]